MISIKRNTDFCFVYILQFLSTSSWAYWVIKKMSNINKTKALCEIDSRVGVISLFLDRLFTFTKFLGGAALEFGKSKQPIQKE